MFYFIAHAQSDSDTPQHVRHKFLGMKLLGVSRMPCSSCGLEVVTDGIIFFKKKRHYTSVGLYKYFCQIYSLGKSTAAGRFGKKNFSKENVFWKFV
jgi:hypothetical protein